MMTTSEKEIQKSMTRLLAFALLILLQFGVTWLSVRSAAVRRLVKNEPKLLFYDGEFLRGAVRMKRCPGLLPPKRRQFSFVLSIMPDP
jgi:uncharacterized membrane protein YcaP (DUF421 family)